MCAKGDHRESKASLLVRLELNERMRCHNRMHQRLLDADALLCSHPPMTIIKPESEKARPRLT